MRSTTITLSFCLLLFACNSNGTKDAGSAKQDTTNNRMASASSYNLPVLQSNIYLKIDEIHAGKIFTQNKNSVFYRVLVVPEEENIMLLAECIKVGDEGGGYQLLKTIRLTDDGGVLPKFGLNQVSDLKFKDSVTIVGKFNGQYREVKLQK